MRFERHRVEWTTEKSSRFWDFVSQNKSLSDKYFGLLMGEHFSKQLNSKVKLKNIKRILDMSCGNGDIIGHILKLINHKQEVYGSDIAEENTRLVNLKYENVYSFKGAIVHNKIHSIFEDGFFDLVVLTEVVEHLRDKELEAIIGSAKRLLVSGGYICITTPNNEDLEASTVMCPDCGCMFHRWQHIRSWNSKSIQEIMESYSFKTKYCNTIVWGSSLKQRLALRLALWGNLIAPNGLIYIGQNN